MIQTRIIPILLLQNEDLVKTIHFKKPNYLGDPINAVKIFNDREVDELIFLDINATKNKTEPNYQLLRDIASECFMPFCYGGGIKDCETIKKLFSLGVEKVAINSEFYKHPEIIKQASKLFGNQSIVVSIDVNKNIFGKYKAFSNGGKINTNQNPIEVAKKAEQLGAGELLINSINKDGTMSGYDLEIINNISKSVNIPVIACGGAGNIKDLFKAINVGASAVAAGSLFVYHGKQKGILINYPDKNNIKKYYNTL